MKIGTVRNKMCGTNYLSPLLYTHSVLHKCPQNPVDISQELLSCVDAW